MPETVSITEREGVQLVAIDRPPVNALDPGLLEELIAAGQDLRSSNPGAVVLAGREGCFSAGLDLKLMPSLDDRQRGEMALAINRMCEVWYGAEFPVIGAITGHAIAGGMVLALCCDLRVGAVGARYGLNEVAAGVPYPDGAMTVVEAELDPTQRRILVLRGELLNGEQAVARGLLDELVAPERVLPRALELARELGALEPAVYALTKHSLRGVARQRIARSVSVEPLLEAGPLARG